MTLEQARVGQTVTVLRVNGAGALRRRLLDMGVLRGTEITVTGAAPLGDPMELALRSYTLTLRRADAALVEVTPSRHPGPPPRRTLTRTLDKLLLHPVLALPIFALVMLGMFWFSICFIGNATEALGAALGDGSLFGSDHPGFPVLLGWWLEGKGCPLWLRDLLLDGVLAGVGTVLGFLPQLTALFLCLSFLEGCGYLSRGAYLLDRVVRRFGLSGSSVVPYILACGCAVPGTMACRTIQRPGCRKATILTAAFLPCAAKLPLIALVAQLAFPGAWWLAPAAYGVGLAAALFFSWLLSGWFPKEDVPFLLELPDYRLPLPGALWARTWERLGEFLQKAGTLLVLASAAVWFASSFGWTETGFRYLSSGALEESLLAHLGEALCPLFSLTGWGEWRAVVACLTGLLAKESVVGTLAILGCPAALYTPAAALSFLLFNLLCPPCVAALSARCQELNHTRLFLLTLAGQTAFALLFSTGLYQGLCLLGRLLG